MYYKSGLPYFMYNTTNNSCSYMNLPEDIRRIIWKYAHIYPITQCYVCEKLLINLEIDYNDKNKVKIVDNYTIINGLTKCNNCFVD